AFSYIPMLRRVRRVSAAARSDPFAGSDFCTDDSRTWNGKNASMKWKFVGQGTYLVPFSSDKKHTLNVLPDGSIEIYHDILIKGYEVAGWKGAPWAPTNCIWNPRPVWVIEGYPKDPYYNYGRQLFYVDQENFINYYKVIYDQSGLYWKTVFYASNSSETTTGVGYIALPNYYLTVDDKTHHSCVAEIQKFPGELDLINMPIEKLGPEWFTESYIRQLSK
ncbi:MAG: outer membrane lipoprotein-sorting protein, partial [Deltaproteobacteria bacterium]|nr:outer membrane lipoprotein-sorting protein [Deltaproteobacteria bacterium]